MSKHPLSCLKHLALMTTLKSVVPGSRMSSTDVASLNNWLSSSADNSDNASAVPLYNASVHRWADRRPASRHTEHQLLISIFIDLQNCSSLLVMFAAIRLPGSRFKPWPGQKFGLRFLFHAHPEILPQEPKMCRSQA